jgi:formylglycine-generating enzyme required for sulfatase activity
MRTRRAVPAALKNRLPVALALVFALALIGPATAGAAPAPSVLTFRTATVGAPGNPSVGIVPFTDAVYSSCAEVVPAEKQPPCQQVGAVNYRYGIGQLEVTVAQYVAFLNTADPAGRNKHKLYSSTESGTEWPKYGQIDFSAEAGAGHHYSVASPEWADKPYGFANFLRSARFANSLSNGQVLSKQSTSAGTFRYVTYRVRLSPQTEMGMYDMHKRAMTRSHKTGFVIPSQNEWIKAAYYDPNGGGKYSYWQYPTNEGAFGDEGEAAPNQAKLDPTTGDVTNASTQPLANFHASETAAPSWCPSAFTASTCATVNPLGIKASAYEKAYQGSLETVGQAKTTSPWGTLDQGGNAVEWTDTITAPPSGRSGAHGRVWRRLHGGISNAPVYQLWLSAVGLQPQDNTFYTATYPWLGIRIGVLGNLKLSKH